MTYRSFTTPDVLLDLLIMRYNMPKPKNPSKEQLKLFTQEKMIPIHFRVFNVLKLWTDKYSLDFKEDTVLVQRVLDFIEGVIQSNKTLAKAGQQILNTLRKIENIQTPRKKLIEFGSQSIPNVQISWNPIQWNILEYNVNVFAEQIFLNTYQIFKRLEPRECVVSNWNSKIGKVASPRLYLMLKNTDAILRWVKAEIYWTSDIRVRVKTTGFFLELAQRLLELGDLHDCFLILKVMENLTKVREFDLVWDWLELKHVRIWNDIKGTNPRGNFKHTEEGKQNNLTTIQIPYYEPELVQFSDINLHFSDITSSGLINFEKRSNLHATYSFLSRAQLCCNTLPDIHSNDEIIKFLTKIPLPSDEQLDYALKHINNAPPEGISPAEQQRQREAAKAEALIQSKLSSGLNDLFSNDSGFTKIADDLFREELLDHLMEPIENSLSLFCQLSELVFKIFIDLSSDSLDASQRVNQNISKIAAIRYPNYTISTWLKMDDQGKIDGEVGEIEFISATNGANEIILVDVIYSIDNTDLEYFRKILEFYSSMENKKAKFSLLTCKIDEDVQKLASNDFDIMVL